MLCVSYININHSYHLSYLYSHQCHIYLDLFIVNQENGWGDYFKPPPPPPAPPTCSSSNFNTGELTQTAQICTIVPDLMNNPNQPGAPVGTTQEGVFCTDPVGTSPTSDSIGPYTLTFNTVPLPMGVMGPTNLIRIELDLTAFEQEEAPNGEPINPLLDPAVNGGGARPDFTITFQGTFSPDCTFRAVSTQGGMITGNMDYWSYGHDSVNVDFTQSGQVTSPISSLGGQFTDVTGLFVSNFAFAFSASFSDHN